MAYKFGSETKRDIVLNFIKTASVFAKSQPFEIRIQHLVKIF